VQLAKLREKIMTTNSTPRQLTDLRSQDNVIHLKQGQMLDAEARRFFKEVFSDERPVSTKLLFEEDGKKVYEAYTDSGSVDYLYIVK
jgi:hypothetical protein